MALPRGPLNSSSSTTPNLAGGVYNAVPPAPADTQECALQLDANGNLKVVQEAGGVASIVQIEDTSGNALNSNGSGALNVAVVSGGGSNASVGVNGAVSPLSSTQVGGSDGTNLQSLQVDGSKNLKTVVNAALPAGTNVIGHVIADTGSTTAVTGNVIVVQPTGASLHTVIDSGSTTAVTGNVTVVQSTGTNLHTVIDSGTVTAVTSITNPVTVSGNSASGAAKSGNPVQIGSVFNTTQPTVTTGQTVESQATSRGAQIVATGIDTFNATINTALPAGGNVIGHVIADSGSTTAVTQATAANLNATVVPGGSAIFEVSPTTAANTNANPFFNSITDGTTKVAVIAATTALKTDLSSVAGSATATGATGVQRVACSGTNAATLDAVTTVATTPANGLATLVSNVTTAPSLTTGQSVSVQGDYQGSLFVKPYRRGQTVAKATTITNSNVATTVLAAQAAGIFADISSFILTTTPVAGVVAQTVFTATLSDGTNSYIFDCDAGDTGSTTVPGTDPIGCNFCFNPPLPATSAATAWTVALSVSTVTSHITVVAVLQKAS